MTKYYLLRLWEPYWVHMYPPKNGEMPRSYTLDEAKDQQAQFLKNMGIETRIIPESEALDYEIPKRW